MSTKYATVEQQKSVVETMSVTEESKRRAEEAGKQWVQETKDTLKEGIKIWNRLVNTDIDAVNTQEQIELFGIANATLKEGKIRDCLLMHACEGTLEKLGESISTDYIEETFLKLEQTTPSMRDIRTMSTILEVCCVYASQEQGYPFALMAYLLWWRGKFHSANDYVLQALERDSSNSLGCLLARVLGAGVVPPWLARECGSFHIQALE